MTLPRDIRDMAGSHLDDRQVAGMMIVVGGGVLDVRLRGYDRVRLVSSTTCSGSFYLVTSDSCSCSDFEYRGGPCKHMLARRIQDALELEQTDLPF